MDTEVILRRPLFEGIEVSQKSKSGYFSATDLVRAGNKWRMSNGLYPFDMSKWLAYSGTKDFINELEESTGEKVKISGQGRGHHTWVHPFLFLDMALAISPQLKIEVYKWVYDELVKYRNDSGNSYKKMCGALWVNSERKDMFPAYIKSVALQIKNALGVDDWNGVSADLLKLRDRVHENIALLADVIRHNDDAVQIGIKKTLEQIKQKELQGAKT